ncbi:IS3 family transposase [Muricauda sp. SCSIO 64092]|uniref:IS3 family transposase n=1 Tax=Allomuricauda sp. SCSIO 64092 TaxID=2908842 RepID=UPI001FF303D3|nr:IS3 family transposase [Muricauda sp. SCSIO 64092]UOY06155.1 IS3 family transposase [Muricauda sp. SCSIO 64092]
MSKFVKARRGLVQREHVLSGVHQCELLDIHRSGLYYASKGETQLNLQLMRLIDEEHMLHSWFGVPRMTERLREDNGLIVNPKRIERLFKLMGISAVGPKPNTSKKGKGCFTRCSSTLCAT